MLIQQFIAKGENVKTTIKAVTVAGCLVLLSACQGMDYYSPYHYGSDEPHAPVTAPSDEYSSYDSNHSSASGPTRRSHGAQYNRPAAPAPSTSSSAEASSSNQGSGALSKTPRFEEQRSAPPPPVVQ